MAKEFNVPPVVFTAGISPSVPQPSRASTSSPPLPFSPSPNPNPNPNSSPIPFLSFDVGSAAAAPSSSFSSAPVLSASLPVSSSFDDEAPLLEELGINTRLIWRKAASILNPFKPDAALHEDADLAGPFLLLLAFGLFQLLAGKLHFGILLGWVTVASLFLYSVFNMLAGRGGNLDLYRCLSLVGYCMLPMVIFSAVALFVPRTSVVVLPVGLVFVLWSTRVCTRLLVENSVSGDEHRGLVAYACWLVYALFSLLVIF